MPPAESSIALYREINECHEAAGFPLRSEFPEFHVFGIDETYPCSRLAMPPFRRGFYQITLLQSLVGTQISFESEMLRGAENVVVFSPPEQVISWVCGGSETGYMLYFKADLLANLGRSIEESFPYFQPATACVLSLEADELARLQGAFEALREASRVAHAYKLPQLSALTTALLYECRGLYDRQGGALPSRMGSNALVARFRQMVARCFSDHCSVESYAGCLNVSADHLRAEVKKHTGRTAREFIDERLLLEARRLLAHTDLNVGEVAWHLQFPEPTHFTRFFKRHTGRTPVEFRREVAKPVAPAA